jgi:hypothetical protein
VSGVRSVNRRAGGPKCMQRAPAYSHMRVHRDLPGLGAFDPATTVSLLHCGGWGACLFSRSSDKGEGVSNGNRPVGPPAARTAARTGQVARDLRRSRVCSLSAARRRLRPGRARPLSRVPVGAPSLEASERVGSSCKRKDLLKRSISVTNQKTLFAVNFDVPLPSADRRRPYV